jgi:hypothetical protein
VFQLPTAVVPPDAPYNGDASGLGPLIGDTPISQTPGGSPTSATINESHSLDVMLYTARLGPTFYWDITEYIGVYGGVGPAVGLVSGRLGFDDNIAYGTSTAHNRGHISGTQMTYGGYANATVVYHAVENGDFYLGAQYMPLGSTTISGGGREGKLKLGGQVLITFGINWPF